MFSYTGSPLEEGNKRSLFLRVTSESNAAAHNAGNESSTAASPTIQFALAMRPNPSSGQVSIDYSMTHETSVKIRMYDVSGRLVRVLANGRQAVGPHSVSWDARDDAGTPVRGGVYFCKMEVGSWTNVKKMVFVPGR